MARLLLKNGRIFVGRPGTGFAEAAAIAGRRIVAVGSLEEVENVAGSFEVVDLAGGVAVPAFCDSHIHLLTYGQNLSGVQLFGAKSPEEAATRVALRAQIARPGSWITGIGWSKEEFSDRRFPTKKPLDDISPHNPVALYSRDYHTLWLNSTALRILGIGKDQALRSDGDILIGEDKEPEGVLLEHAAKEAFARIPQQSDVSKMAALDAAFGRLYSLGVLSAHNMDSDGDMDLFSRMDEEGRLGIRVVAYIGSKALDDAMAVGLHTGGPGGLRLRFGGLKLIKDGTLGSQTAMMIDPYEASTAKGMDLMPEAQLNELIKRANDRGIGVAVHAIGDAANREVLDAFSKSGRQEKWLVNRMEHVQLLSEEDLPRPAALGLASSMQPVHMEGDIGPAEMVWGGRCRFAYAMKSLQRSGSPLLFGSDAPVADPNPLLGIYHAVTRKCSDGKPERGWYPEERLTVEEAVRAYTWNPSELYKEHGERGSIEPGKLADIAVLDEDIFSCHKDRIRKAKVTVTMMEGDIVYRV